MFNHAMTWLVRKVGVETVVYGIFLLIFCAVVGLFVFGEHIIVTSTSKDVTFVVDATEVKRVNDKDLYLVRITHVSGTAANPVLGESETVQVQDRWTLGNIRSADVYFELKQTEGTGIVWRGTIGGWRNGFFSWFPEIIRLQNTGKDIK